MNMNLIGCFVDARRRKEIHKSRGDKKDELKEWIGLGSKTAYKEALRDGYMIWVNNPPASRCMGWLCFTKKGLAKYKTWNKTWQK